MSGTSASFQIDSGGLRYSRLSFGRITTPSDSMSSPRTAPIHPLTPLLSHLSLLIVSSPRLARATRAFPSWPGRRRSRGDMIPGRVSLRPVLSQRSIHHHHPAEKQTFAQENKEQEGQGGRSSTAQALKRGSTLWKSRPLHRDHIPPNPPRSKDHHHHRNYNHHLLFSLYIPHAA